MASIPPRETIPEGPTLHQTPPALSTLVGRYAIKHELGRGGMGQVFAAVDEKLERPVAVKLLNPGPHTAEELLRFEREARAAGALNHPNILTVFDVGVHEGAPFMVTELLEGGTLRSRLAEGPFPAAQAASIALQIARGLAVAHEKGIVHRDLKPENVFLTRDGRAKILDFGIAKLTAGGQRPATLETGKGVLLGTLGYMSPEQLRGLPANTRSDIFGCGVILYEMLCGRLPFPDDGSPLIGGIAAVTGEPAPMVAGIPAALQAVVQRCLEKDPARRFESAAALAQALEAPAERRGRHRWRALIVVSVLAAAIAVWLWQRAARMRWAQAAIPRVVELVEKGDFSAAYALGAKVEKVVPTDPVLLRLWPEMSQLIAVETDPPGADVYVREYSAAGAAFQHLGKTPLAQTRLPLAFLRWRVIKEGFEPLERASSALEGWPVIPGPLSAKRIGTLRFALDKAGSVPKGMVRVRGGRVSAGVTGLDHLPPVELPDYLIDRSEVTNRDFKSFVDGGGYRRRELWEAGPSGQPWEGAIAPFVDRTGRPGPSTWESGSYPDGQGDLPVTGVSWYEAAAYAAFTGKRLPTLYHWTHAAGLWAAEAIAPTSNFSGVGLLPAGPERGFSPFGAFDMAGNAKEWCWNAMGDRRYIMGGAWNEADYSFNEADAQPPMDRAPTHGFRLMISPPASKAELPLLRDEPDYRKERPVAADVFDRYRKLYEYDPAALDASVDAVDDSDPRWRKETVNFAAAYGKERVTGYLFTPRTSKPPWQVVIYFPTGSATQRNADVMAQVRFFDSFVKSGRAVFFPVSKGMYQRYDDFDSIPRSAPAYRAHVIAWSNDLGRSIDYLQSRTDIDGSRIAYVGSSFGARMGPLLVAVERRIKTAIWLGGGLSLERSPPEVDPFNFAPRVHQPVLMINGRLDWIRPPETTQFPLFRALGTAEQDKRHVLSESGHFPPREIEVRESLAWLDLYLGPVW